MNLNTGFFAAYCYRRKQPTVEYRVPLNSQQHQHSLLLRNAQSLIDITNGSESFLPSIPTAKDSNDGHRPYRRNDFANNHLFIAKHKLARVFLDRPTVNTELTDDLIHLFDPYEPKQKHRRKYKNKRQNKSDCKSISTFDQDVHLSVINLVMKPSLSSSQTPDPISTISYRHAQAINFQTRAPRPSIAWVNPAITQYFQSTSNHLIKDQFETNTIINELLDNKSDIINNTINPLDSSVSYVKSIINVSRPKQD
ncbi:unnamed protein product [Rotaria sordida]|uniref:Uncharacterized protein n=1 Tax=Rotaria sordida TaxID=392033 RepID=A0A814P4E7_9BILA|nr:unnamed protein product [Rotaria sordida]